MMDFRQIKYITIPNHNDELVEIKRILNSKGDIIWERHPSPSGTIDVGLIGLVDPDSIQDETKRNFVSSCIDNTTIYGDQVYQNYDNWGQSRTITRADHATKINGTNRYQVQIDRSVGSWKNNTFLGLKITLTPSRDIIIRYNNPTTFTHTLNSTVNSTSFNGVLTPKQTKIRLVTNNTYWKVGICPYGDISFTETTLLAGQTYTIYVRAFQSYDKYSKTISSSGTTTDLWTICPANATCQFYGELHYVAAYGYQYLTDRKQTVDWFNYLTVTLTVKTYNVTFNANGGSVSQTSKLVASGGTYGSLPTPTRTGYVFDGWYTTASGGTQILAITVETISSDHTLYAHWA